MAAIAVFGLGAIGGTMAAWLYQNPEHRIHAVSRHAIDGIRVRTGDETIDAHPRIVRTPEEATPVDWLLIATKAYDAPASQIWIERFCGPDTFVAILQNGVEHIERYRAFVSPDKLLPVVVECPAERDAPGQIRQRGKASLIVPEDTRGRAFAELFAHSPVEVSQTADFTTALWKKLCLNSAGAVSALVLQPAGIVQRPPIAAMMTALVQECAAVARAEGARLDADIVGRIMEMCRNAPLDSVNSMLADRSAGRPMEIDARNGAVVRFGRKHGILTEMNELVVALLQAAEEGPPRDRLRQ